jgi:hypothetical protein
LFLDAIEEFGSQPAVIARIIDQAPAEGLILQPNGGHLARVLYWSILLLIILR